MLQEIVALDQEVLAKQERMKQLESELVSLQNSGLVVSAGGGGACRAGQLLEGLLGPAVAARHYLPAVICMWHGRVPTPLVCDGAWPAARCAQMRPRGGLGS